MGVTFPTPESLKTYIHREEYPRRLLESADLPVSDIFRYGAMVGSRIHTYTSLPRCMDQARQLITQHSAVQRSFPSGTMIFAESLSGSKGRFTRPWHAPDGGLWCVLTLFNQWSRQVTSLLPLAAGVAVCETVRGLGLQAQIKWVNDICHHGLKLAGLLAETHVCPLSGEEYILLGIGLNVNNNEFPAELHDIATSLARQTGEEYSLFDIGQDLLAKLAWNIGLLTWFDEHDMVLTPFMDRYRALCDSVGRTVSFGFDVQKTPQFEGLVTAINDDGGLVLHHLQDDVELVEHGGEIVYRDT